MYVPRPVSIKIALEIKHLAHAKEIFALSKMNWNSTQFDGVCRDAYAASSVGKV